MAKKASETNLKIGTSQEAIARRAYEIWESDGRPDGRAMDHWLRAVSELDARHDGESELHAEPRETAPATPQRTGRRSAPRRNEGRFQTTQ